jgi:hypothetical protein
MAGTLDSIILSPGSASVGFWDQKYVYDLVPKYPDFRPLVGRAAGLLVCSVALDFAFCYLSLF